MKKIFISIDKDTGRLVGGWSETRCNDSDIEIEVPDDHPVLDNPFVYVYKDKKLVKDEEYHKKQREERRLRQEALPLPKQVQQLKKQYVDLVYQLMKGGIL